MCAERAFYALNDLQIDERPFAPLSLVVQISIMHIKVSLLMAALHLI